MNMSFSSLLLATYIRCFSSRKPELCHHVPNRHKLFMIIHKLQNTSVPTKTKENFSEDVKCSLDQFGDQNLGRVALPLSLGVKGCCELT